MMMPEGFQSEAMEAAARARLRNHIVQFLMGIAALEIGQPSVLGTICGGMMSTPIMAVTPFVDTKRKTRNMSEKKRRDAFNRLINELASFVTDGSRKLDKSNVLKQTIVYLKKQQSSDGIDVSHPSPSLPFPQTTATSSSSTKSSPTSQSTSPEQTSCGSSTPSTNLPGIGTDQQLTMEMQARDACTILISGDGQCTWQSANASVLLKGKQCQPGSSCSLNELFDEQTVCSIQQLISNQVLQRAAPRATSITTDASRYHEFTATSNDLQHTWSMIGRFFNRKDAHDSLCFVALLHQRQLTTNLLDQRRSDSTAEVSRSKCRLLSDNLKSEVEQRLSFSCLIDDQTQILTVEKQVWLCLGYTAHELVGHTVYEICHTSDLHKLNIMSTSCIVDSAVTPATQLFQLRLRTKQGSWVYANLRCTEISAADQPISMAENEETNKKQSGVGRRRYVCTCTVDCDATASSNTSTSTTTVTKNQSNSIANFSIAALKSPSDPYSRAVTDSVCSIKSVMSSMLNMATPSPAGSTSSNASVSLASNPNVSGGTKQVEKPKRQSNVWIESTPLSSTPTATSGNPVTVTATPQCTTTAVFTIGPPINDSLNNRMFDSLLPNATATPTAAFDPSLLSENDRAIWQQQENRRFALLQQVWAQQRELLQLQQLTQSGDAVGATQIISPANINVLKSDASAL